jgi:hypothetical protein
MCPAAGWVAWGFQVVSIASVLVGLGLAALWVVPPYWVPHVYGLALVIIVVGQLARGIRGSGGLWQASATNSVAVMLVFGLGLLGSFMGFQALQARLLPEAEVVNIVAPFPSGHYLVAHGGATEMANVHLKTMDETVERFRPWRGQSKGLDIFRITPMGLHKEGWQPTDPAQYLTFGTPVLSPCQGKVAMVVDEHPDMTVPEMDRSYLPGNFVAIDCSGFVVVLAHLHRGSITVGAGDRVDVGDSLGQMGNSGNSSQPHLHVHAQRGLPLETPLGGEPLWMTINGQFLVRNDRVRVP